MNQEIQLLELFHRISRKIGKTFTPIFREQKLSHAEIVALFVMHKRKTCRVCELANIIGVPASTLTGILDRLEAQGFLEREPDPEDRRSWLVNATSRLTLFIHSLMTPLEKRIQQVFRSLPEGRLDRLISDLKYVLESLDRADDTITGKCHQHHAPDKANIRHNE